MDELDRSIFNIDIPSGKPGRGSLLISEPFLREEWFRHSVIYLIEHEIHGSSMGFVLNHQTDIKLSDVVDNIPAEYDTHLFCGGPVSQDQLYYLHRLGDLIEDSQRISEDMYVSGDFDSIIKYIRSGYPTDRFIRFFLGYSGWNQNQLEDEIAGNVWAVTTAMTFDEILSGSGDAYWHRYVKMLGDSHKGWLYHPEDPQSN